MTAIGSASRAGRGDQGVRRRKAGDLRDQVGKLAVRGNCLPEQVIDQHGVRELEEAGEGLPLPRGGLR